MSKSIVQKVGDVFTVDNPKVAEFLNGPPPSDIFKES